MLGKEFRLRRRGDFKRVYAQGSSVVTQWLVIYALLRNEGSPRFGFSISKRLGKAVVRNRLKRRLSEAVKSIGATSGPPRDYVIIARSGVKDRAFSDICYAVRNGFSRIEKRAKTASRNEDGSESTLR
ncbi:MAG: ribonuclease P protein component [Armatimonadetes bacterium]|nr:ribonuclease P protein component [Armatimonadota bacterium]